MLPAANGTGLWRDWRTIPTGDAGGIISAVLWFVFQRTGLSVSVKQNAGLASMLLNCAGVAALNVWGSVQPRPGEIHISWIAVVILVYSMIAPTAPDACCWRRWSRH